MRFRYVVMTFLTGAVLLLDQPPLLHAAPALENDAGAPSLCDLARSTIEASLKIVRSEHNHDQIQR